MRVKLRDLLLVLAFERKAFEPFCGSIRLDGRFIKSFGRQSMELCILYMYMQMKIDFPGNQSGREMWQ